MMKDKAKLRTPNEKKNENKMHVKLVQVDQMHFFPDLMNFTVDSFKGLMCPLPS